MLSKSTSLSSARLAKCSRCMVLSMAKIHILAHSSRQHSQLKQRGNTEYSHMQRRNGRWFIMVASLMMSCINWHRRVECWKEVRRIWKKQARFPDLSISGDSLEITLIKTEKIVKMCANSSKTYRSNSAFLLQSVRSAWAFGPLYLHEYLLTNFTILFL